MKKQFIRHYSFLAAVLFLTMLVGCTLKTYSVLKERPDQESRGNKGILTGEVPEDTSEAKEMRKTYVMEVEFGKGAVDGEVVSEVAEEEVEEVVAERVEEVVFEPAEEVVAEEVEEVVIEAADEVVYEVVEESEELSMPMK
ncbi:hypothetical protein ACFL2J_06155 [Candidatus Omnitrophota bacterium]